MAYKSSSKQQAQGWKRQDKKADKALKSLFSIFKPPKKRRKKKLF